MPVQQTKPNLVFALEDQARFWPELYETLPSTKYFNVDFTNHYINGVMCSSSRANMYTGLPTWKHGIIDNVNTVYQKSLDTSLPTVGKELKKQGYKVAYIGKWHLGRGVITADMMEKYGFDFFQVWGDPEGVAHQGFEDDPMVTMTGKQWLKSFGKYYAEIGQPVAIFFNIVQPHDIAFYNSPGSRGIMSMGAPEGAPQYKVKLPAKMMKSSMIDKKSMIPAHENYKIVEDIAMGPVIDYKDFQTYYANCLREGHKHFSEFLEMVTATFDMKNTYMMQTSDHGDHAGSWGLHGKGNTSFEENIHVPFRMWDPTVKGKKTMSGLTNHLQILPSFVDLAKGKKPSVYTPLECSVFNSQMYIFLAETSKRKETEQVIRHVASLSKKVKYAPLDKVTVIDQTKKGHHLSVTFPPDDKGKVKKIGVYFSPATVKTHGDLVKAIKDKDVDWETLHGDYKKETQKKTSEKEKKEFLKMISKHAGDYVTVKV
ncbi:sulfatase [Tetraselmis virus 1]|uniref:Sulfatase n=1 Tax=Tetraselmis virus 1 TaxID=2060617 RepID=A0A2P0VMI1_9VIRU|nr:sulfatase [Tetraselmis virus 1]AUF82100.1 sulfatase [Tetraselmis virus 1]